MKILERGQITIPKRLRDRYGITPETELEFIPQLEGILLVKRGRERSSFREVFGMLKNVSSTDAHIEELRGR